VTTTGWIGDVRHALRSLRRNPGFAAAAVATLALGIGVNTALFMVVDAAMFRRLPVEAPDKLFLLAPVDARGHAGGGFDFGTFESLRDRGRPFIEMFAFDSMPWRVEAAGQAEVLLGAAVSGSFSKVLRTRPILGRPLGEIDDRPSSAPAAVISEGYWRRRFGGDPGVLGQTIDIRWMSFRIVGVAPRGFSGIEPGHLCEVWVPMSFWPALRLKDHDTVGIMGRLRPGVTQEAAQAALTVVFRDGLNAAAGFAPSPERRREIAERSIGLRPGARGTGDLREELSRRLLLLLGASGLLLLIACANVTNLQLARAGSRQREIAIRIALGAGTGRLLRQLLTESFLLAFAGGLAGVIAAAWSSAALVAAVAGRALPVSPATGGRVFLFSAVVSFAAALLFGLAPALRAAAGNPAEDLKGTQSAVASRRRLSLSDGLVIAQFALSLSLAVGAGLLARSLGELHGVDPGFRREGVLLFWLYPTLSGVEGPAEINFYRTVEERLLAVPGVRSASDFRFGFFAGRWKRPAFAAGESSRHGTREVFFDAVGPNFFETMGVSLRAGREFSERDGPASPRVAVINRTAARLLFREESPLGRRIAFDDGSVAAPGSSGEEAEIVGIVTDTRTFTLRDAGSGRAQGVAYVPVSQAPASLLGQMNFAVRGDGDPRALLPGVSRAVASVAPDIPLTGVRTLTEQMDASLGQERSLVRLFSFFGALALLLAGVGLHGVMAYSVARRTREIGVRMALGATRALVLRTVLRRGLALSLAGLLLGLVFLPAITRVLSSLLYGISPADPVTLLGAALALAAVSLAAAYVPAWRATRVDPAETLRWE
jgi:putative ABC transport system permease protein